MTLIDPRGIHFYIFCLFLNSLKFIPSFFVYKFLFLFLNFIKLWIYSQKTSLEIPVNRYIGGMPTNELKSQERSLSALNR